MRQDIHVGSTESLPIEAAVKAAIPRATVLRTQFVDNEYNDKPDLWLTLINTQRTFGHFAVLEWNPQVGALHTGHYFDSMNEAVADFNGRGGLINI